MISHHRSSRYNATLPDADAGKNDAVSCDPHVISDPYGPYFFRWRGTPRNTAPQIDHVSIGVHDGDVAGKKAVFPDGNHLADGESAPVSDLCVITYFEPRPIRETRRKVNADLSPEDHVVAQYYVALALNPVDLGLGVEISPVTGAVGLE